MPARRVSRAATNRQLMDPEFREYAFKSLWVLDGEPALHFRLGDGETYTVPFMDVYCQALGPQNLRFEDLVTTALRWQEVLRGELIYRGIRLTGEPFSDADTERNRALVKEAVSYHQSIGDANFLDADFKGGTRAGQDGYVAFSAPPHRGIHGRLSRFGW